MGAWGKGIYDNDDACDFVGEVVDSLDLSRINAAVNESPQRQPVPRSPSSLLHRAWSPRTSLPGCTPGQWGDRNSYTGVIAQWAERAKVSASDEPCSKPARSSNACAPEPSELRLELWSDDPDPETWHAALDTLLQRLS